MSYLPKYFLNGTDQVFYAEKMKKKESKLAGLKDLKLHILPIEESDLSLQFDEEEKEEPLFEDKESNQTLNSQTEQKYQFKISANINLDQHFETKHNYTKAIAIAANTQYFSALKNLVHSIQYWNGIHNQTFLIYDLGMTDKELKMISKWCGQIILFPKFLLETADIDDKYQNLFQNSSSGFQLNYEKHEYYGLAYQKQHLIIPTVYAWKPLLIAHSLKLYSTVLYIDAGSTTNAPLTPIWNILKNEGVFLMTGQDTDLTRWTHDGMFTYLKLKKELFIGLESFAGSTMGFRRDFLTAQNLVPKLVDCALESECISPIGSSLSNHRYDQSALSVLTYDYIFGSNETLLVQRQVVHPIKKHTEFLTNDRQECFKENFEKIFWTSRRSQVCYGRLWKPKCDSIDANGL